MGTVNFFHKPKIPQETDYQSFFFFNRNKEHKAIQKWNYNLLPLWPCQHATASISLALGDQISFSNFGRQSK